MDAPTDRRTVLSAGLAIVRLLEASERVTALVGSKIYPVFSKKEVEAPYIIYRRAALESTQVKTGMPADSAIIDVWCYGSTYGQGVDIAEAVRTALECRQTSAGGLAVRRCTLIEAEEDAISPDGVMVQMMKFEIRI